MIKNKLYVGKAQNCQRSFEKKNPMALSNKAPIKTKTNKNNKDSDAISFVFLLSPIPRYLGTNLSRPFRKIDPGKSIINAKETTNAKAPTISGKTIFLIKIPMTKLIAIA